MSKWEDTMMSPEELVPYLSTTDSYLAVCVDYKKAFAAQAKISFPAGIRELLEWLDKEQFIPRHSASILNYGKPKSAPLICNEHCKRCKIESKLKEWGIE